MSLAQKIRDVLNLSDVSKTTKDIALKEIIDTYRINAFKIKDNYENKRYDPAINDVIKGKTTYWKEFNRLGGVNFMLTGNMEITGGNIDMEESIKLVDETIKRLYIK